MLAGFDYIAEKARQNIAVCAGDYTVDGLLYCGKCHTPKQCRIEILGEIRMPYHLCQCEEERDRKMQAQKRQEQIERMRSACFPDTEMCGWRFEADDGTGDKKAMSVMKNYAKHFDVMCQKQLGLLIFGDVGVGKSFAAACVANALLDKGYSCYMTNFSRIFNELWSVSDKQEYMNHLNHNSLLVIDDLATERSTEYASEIVTAVINSRCNTGKPVIITTNLKPDDLLHPKNTSNFKSDDEIVRKKRVFSRLFEMTIPVQYTGTDRRRKIMQQNCAGVRDLLGL